MRNFHGVILNGKTVARDLKAAQDAIILATGCKREDIELTISPAFPKEQRHLLPKHRVVKK